MNVKHRETKHWNSRCSSVLENFLKATYNHVASFYKNSMKFCPGKYPRKKKKTGIRSFAAAQSNRSIEWSTRHLRDRKQLVRRTSVNLWTAEGFASVSWSFGALEDCEWLSFYAAPAELVTRHRFPTGLQARKIGRRNWHRFKIPHKKIEQRDHLQSRGKNIVDKLLRRCYLIEAAILKIRYPIL